MMEPITNKPFIVAMLAGVAAQFLKVISFLIVEKKVNYKRFVQAHGLPNLHSAAMSALTVAVGFKDGFGSMVFALAVCVTAVVLVDTMNVKTAASRQAEAVLIIVDWLRKKKTVDRKRKPGLSYTPIDVLAGVVVGVIVALVVF